MTRARRATFARRKAAQFYGKIERAAERLPMSVESVASCARSLCEMGIGSRSLFAEGGVIGEKHSLVLKGVKFPI